MDPLKFERVFFFAQNAHMEKHMFLILGSIRLNKTIKLKCITLLVSAWSANNLINKT